MLDRAGGKSMADLKNALPKTWSSPTMSPHCADELKYNVVDAVVKHFEAAQKQGENIGGQAIRDLVTVNGVRITIEDGSRGQVRASPTSRSSSSWSRARCRKSACTRWSTACYEPIPKSASTIRRSERGEADENRLSAGEMRLPTIARRGNAFVDVVAPFQRGAKRVG
jgi:hypothetical protein